MKKFVLSLCCIFFVLPFASGQNNYSNYLKVLFSQPTGSYKDYYKSGFGFEYGKIFDLGFNLGNKDINAGIDITFINTSINFGKDYSYFTASNIDGIRYDFYSQGGLMWQVGVKLGPAISMEIADHLMADFSIQYDPTIVVSFRKGANEHAWSNGMGRFDKKSASAIAFANMFSLKGDIRYEHFLFGLEFKLGNKTLTYSEKIIPYTVPIITNNPTLISFDDEKEMGLGSFFVSIGYMF